MVQAVVTRPQGYVHLVVNENIRLGSSTRAAGEQLKEGYFYDIDYMIDELGGYAVGFELTSPTANTGKVLVGYVKQGQTAFWG